MCLLCSSHMLNVCDAIMCRPCEPCGDGMTTADTGATDASNCLANPGWEVVAVATARQCPAGEPAGLSWDCFSSLACTLHSCVDFTAAVVFKAMLAAGCVGVADGADQHQAAARSSSSDPSIPHLLQVHGVLEVPLLAPPALLAPPHHQMCQPHRSATVRSACLAGAAMAQPCVHHASMARTHLLALMLAWHVQAGESVQSFFFMHMSEAVGMFQCQLQCLKQ